MRLLFLFAFLHLGRQIDMVGYITHNSVKCEKQEIYFS